VLSALYTGGGHAAPVTAITAWVRPVVLAVILQAAWRLGRSAITTSTQLFFVVLLMVLSLCGLGELLLLFGSGIATVLKGYLSGALRDNKEEQANARALLLFCFLILLLAFGLSSIALVGGAPPSLAEIFLYFARLGAVLYGSGYVLFAFLQTDLVQKLHWLTQSQLFDAVAIGQVTPGPLFTSATFIGFLLRGLPGASLATLAIFLPAFLFVRFTGPIVVRLRLSPVASSFLDSINLASLALMGAVAVKLALALSLLPLAVAALSLILLLRYKINSAWIILTAAILGAVCRLS
jgi:chromate transporter